MSICDRRLTVWRVSPHNMTRIFAEFGGLSRASVWSDSKPFRNISVLRWFFVCWKDFFKSPITPEDCEFESHLSETFSSAGCHTATFVSVCYLVFWGEGFRGYESYHNNLENVAGKNYKRAYNVGKNVLIVGGEVSNAARGCSQAGSICSTTASKRLTPKELISEFRLIRLMNISVCHCCNRKLMPPQHRISIQMKFGRELSFSITISFF